MGLGLGHERRVLLLALGASLPAVCVALLFVTGWAPGNTAPGNTVPGNTVRWTMAALVLGSSLICLLVLRERCREWRRAERLPASDPDEQDWQRLIRVLSHEINNSLAPIQSIAATLRRMFEGDALPDDWRRDVERGLEIVQRRCEGLDRFVTSYARLARLPAPKLEQVHLAECLQRVVALETRLHVGLSAGPDLTIQADGDQLEQAMINLVRNAVDAALETAGSVELSWHNGDRQVEIWIDDEGPGLGATDKPFVPFLTTKPGGSGIGLTLSRQIIEAHGGTLLLDNHSGRRGCRATVRLPRSGRSGIAQREP